MKIVLALAFQLAAGTTDVTVKTAARETRIPIVFTSRGTMVRANEVATALGGTLTRRPDQKFTFSVEGTPITLTLDVPFAALLGDAVPLTPAPVLREGVLYVSAAILTDVIPRAIIGYSFDPATAQLRRATPAVAANPASARVPIRRDTGARVSRGDVSARRPVRPERRPIVVVDAGHGGPDRGMRGPIGARDKIHEADITLQFSRRLRETLEQRGVEVIMTRSKDTLIALADRGKIANRAGADLFLSIHVNAANPRWRQPAAARGFETYFLAEAKTEDEKRVEEMENDVAKYDVDVDAGNGDAISFILADMLQNEYLRESSNLAQVVQDGLARVHPSKENRGVKQAGFRVLIEAHMPAVLIELGFGTNASEARYLASTAGQRELASAIADAAISYLSNLQRRAGNTPASQ
jgi:N-acetylmuramoyl-L-alanine amidase